MTIEAVPLPPTADLTPLQRVSAFPRLRYMGSKYRLADSLFQVFGELGGSTAVDAFSGSGVVSYLLKSQGFAVTSNDFLHFPGTITRATVTNSSVTLSDDEVDAICGTPLDDRDFIQQTFGGRFLSPADLAFLDAAWSHIDTMSGHARDIALSALVLSAARKQPRGVFTFTGTRYDDGRRDLRLPMAAHFRERVADYNAVVFDDHQVHTTVTGDVSALTSVSPDIAYLDPPYAPAKDDADYMKRYHFLEGLSVYWRGQQIMEETKTKKIAKRFTPFAYKRTIESALADVFDQFRSAGAIVLSYSSNAVPDASRIVEILGQFKRSVEIREIAHTYSFGTHSTANRKTATEYLFIGRE